MKKIKGVLLPPFSELELLTFVYLIVWIVLEQFWKYPLETQENYTMLGNSFLTSATFLLKNGQVAELLLLSLTTMVLVVLVVWLVKALYLMIFTKQKVTHKTKRYFAFVFYFVMAMVTYVALIQQGEGKNVGLIATINQWVFGYMMLRSVLGVYLSNVLFKTGKLESHFTDEQVGKVELLLLLILTPLTLNFLRIQGTYNSEALFILAYFYTTTTLIGARKTINWIKSN